MPRKKYSRKRLSRNKYSRNKYSRNKYSRKRVSRKRLSRKRLYKKRISRKRISRKRKTKHKKGGGSLINTSSFDSLAIPQVKKRKDQLQTKLQSQLQKFKQDTSTSPSPDTNFIHSMLWHGDSSNFKKANVHTTTIKGGSIKQVKKTGDYTYTFNVGTDDLYRINGYIPYTETKDGQHRRIRGQRHQTKAILSGKGNIVNFADLGFIFDQLEGVDPDKLKGLKVMKDKRRSLTSNYYVCYNEDHVIMCISQDPRKSNLLKRWYVFTLPDDPSLCEVKTSIKQTNKILKQFHSSKNASPLTHRCTIQQSNKMITIRHTGKAYRTFFVLDPEQEEEYGYLYYDESGAPIGANAYAGFSVFLTVKNTEKLNQNIYAFVLSILSRENPKQVIRRVGENTGKMAIAKGTAGLGTVGLENLITVDPSFSSFPASVVKEQVVTSTLDASSAESNKVKHSQ